MANLKEIRTRVASVKTTKQITSAMKMVAAAKLRKAQDAVIQMRPFSEKLQQILLNLADNIQSEEVGLYKDNRDLKKILLVVITSNKGLCGGFNSSITKQVLIDLNAEFKQLHDTHKVDVLTIGKKGGELLHSKGVHIHTDKNCLLDDINYKEVKELATELIDQFISGEYDLIKLYYNQFKNAGTQLVTEEQYLPFPEIDKDDLAANFDYILEPSQNEIVEDLIPKSLKTQLFKAVLESNASEQGARMTAMHKATDNATDLIKDLQLEYNKARQAAITNEILEIVGGAEALK